MVRVALRTGAVVPCAGRLTQTIKWRPPAPPVDLVAQPHADSVTLLWQPAKAGDGKLNGYRVFRDGKPFRDVKTTTLTIALPPLRTYSMTVAAIDTQGQASAMSNVVVIRADHAAPTTPAGLTAAATSASDVALTWQPATGFGGARVAYRVLRNGITFGQTSAISMTIGNLAPSTAYTFTVMAVDSLGYASAPSAPATATTQPPIQSTGVAHVFLLASTGASFRAFQAHYQEIGTVYPTYYECNADGSFNGGDVPLITSWARARGVKVEARWNCQRTTTLHYMLVDPATRAALESQMVNAAVASNWDGINIDFEAGAAADRDLLTTFITELANALHAQGKSAVDGGLGEGEGRPEPPALDVLRLRRARPARRHDLRHVLGDPLEDVGARRDRRHDVGEPGRDVRLAAAEQAEVRARVRHVRLRLAERRRGSNPATPLEYNDVQALAQQYSATLQWDP